MNELFTPQLGRLMAYAFLAGLVGILIYGVFRLVWRFVLPLIRKPNTKAWLTQWLPMVEILIWVVFVLMSMGYLISANFVPGLIFSLILLGGFWPYLLNLMGGMVIRMGNRLRVGQRVRIDSSRGVISRMGLLEMDLQMDGGQTMVIPYHQFPQTRFILEDPEDEIARYVLELSVNPTWSIDEAQERILASVMRLPWASVGRFPIIEPMIHDKKKALYRVVLYASHQKYFLQMEQLLQARFASEIVRMAKS